MMENKQEVEVLRKSRRGKCPVKYESPERDSYLTRKKTKKEHPWLASTVTPRGIFKENWASRDAEATSSFQWDTY